MTTTNGFETIAKRNIKHAINWILGGYYNCLQDDTPEYLPASREELFNEIYNSCLNNTYGPGVEFYGRPIKEMRFAGEAFIRDTITRMLEKDGDYLEIADYCGW